MKQIPIILVNEVESLGQHFATFNITDREREGAGGIRDVWMEFHTTSGTGSVRYHRSKVLANSLLLVNARESFGQHFATFFN